MALSQSQPIAPRVSGEKSVLPALALLAGWLIPGAGHLLLGKWIRGLLLFISLVCMFAIGIALSGKVYVPTTGDVLDLLGFVGELGNGLLYVLARALNWGAPSAVNTLADYGSKFLLSAGLLNMIAAVDALSLANGRKASN